MNTLFDHQLFNLPNSTIFTLQSKTNLPVITSSQNAPSIRCCTGCGGCCDDDCAAGNTVG